MDNKGYFTGFYAIYETNNYILLERVTETAGRGCFFCDKKTRQGNYYMYSSNECAIPFVRIRYSYDDTFVGVANADELVKEWNIPGEEGKKFKEQLSGMKEDDNPVLFFYKFN